MSLWVLLALGLNLREDRPCGRLREIGGLGPDGHPGLRLGGPMRGPSYGAVMPFWQVGIVPDEGRRRASRPKPPAYEIARENYLGMPSEIDHYNVKPWIGLADLEFAYWKSPEPWPSGRVIS